MIQKTKSAIFELVCRWYVFIFLNVYGLGKIAGGQFYPKGQLPPEIAKTPLEHVSAFDLGWTFMGYSYAYILFIGFSQVIGAWFLLWNRTKLLGVGILIPIMLNIIIFDLIFLNGTGPTANATIYFLMLLYILYFNKMQVIAALQALTMNVPQESLTWKKRIPIIVLVLIIMGMVFWIDQFLVDLLGREVSN